MMHASTHASLAAWTSEDLLRFGLLFFLFVLPALKALLEKKRAAERERGTGQAPPPDFDDDDPWKRLLRGETVSTPPPPRVPAPPRSTRSLEDPAPPPRSLEHAPRPPTRSFEDLPLPPTGSLEHTHSSEDARTQSFSESFTEAFAEKTADASLFESEPLHELDVELASLGERSTLGERSVLEGAGLSSALDAPRGGLGSALDRGGPLAFAPIDTGDDWLRAVVLAEILAAPLALRGDGGAPLARPH